MAKANIEKSRSSHGVAPWRPFLSEPFRELDRMKREMDRLWESFLPEAPRRGEFFGGMEWSPEFDLSETDNELILRAEVPGMNPKDIDISLVDNMLRIKGEKKQEMEEKNENYHFVGRSYGSFARSIPLPVEVQGDKVNASYRDGVLKVVFPKSEKAKAKEIQIKVEGEKK